jgi:hypothetical protein
MEDFYRQVHAMDGNAVVFPEAYPPSKQQWCMKPHHNLLAVPSMMLLTALLRALVCSALPGDVPCSMQPLLLICAEQHAIGRHAWIWSLCVFCADAGVLLGSVEVVDCLPADTIAAWPDLPESLKMEVGEGAGSCQWGPYAMQRLAVIPLKSSQLCKHVRGHAAAQQQLRRRALRGTMPWQRPPAAARHQACACSLAWPPRISSAPSPAVPTTLHIVHLLASTPASPALPPCRWAAPMASCARPR